MTRFLKPKNIHRLIIALVLLAPIVYLFGSYFAYLIGAHGNATAPDLGGFFQDNFLYWMGRSAVVSDMQYVRGFIPLAQLFRYIDESFLHLSGSNIALTGYGYIWYVCHVLIFDLIAMAFVFIITIPHKLLDWFNGHAGGDW